MDPSSDSNPFGMDPGETTRNSFAYVFASELPHSAEYPSSGGQDKECQDLLQEYVKFLNLSSEEDRRPPLVPRDFGIALREQAKQLLKRLHIHCTCLPLSGVKDVDPELTVHFFCRHGCALVLLENRAERTLDVKLVTCASSGKQHHRLEGVFQPASIQQEGLQQRPDCSPPLAVPVFSSENDRSSPSLALFHDVSGEDFIKKVLEHVHSLETTKNVHDRPPKSPATVLHAISLVRKVFLSKKDFDGVPPLKHPLNSEVVSADSWLGSPATPWPLVRSVLTNLIAEAPASGDNPFVAEASFLYFRCFLLAKACQTANTDEETARSLLQFLQAEVKAAREKNHIGVDHIEPFAQFFCGVKEHFLQRQKAQPSAYDLPTTLPLGRLLGVDTLAVNFTNVATEEVSRQYNCTVQQQRQSKANYPAAAGSIGQLHEYEQRFCSLFAALPLPNNDTSANYTGDDVAWLHKTAYSLPFRKETFPSKLVIELNSLLYLFKIGASCVALEYCKTHYRHTDPKPNVFEALNSYRPPFEAGFLEEHFCSFREGPRQVARRVAAYLRAHCEKQPLFQLRTGANPSFTQFAQAGCEDFPGCRDKLSAMKQAWEGKKKVCAASIEKYRSQLEDLGRSIAVYEGQTCSCTDSEFRWSKCWRCDMLEKKRSEKKRVKEATVSLDAAPFPSSVQGQQNYAFLLAMPTLLRQLWDLCAVGQCANGDPPRCHNANALQPAHSFTFQTGATAEQPKARTAGWMSIPGVSALEVYSKEDITLVRGSQISDSNPLGEVPKAFYDPAPDKQYNRMMKPPPKDILTGSAKSEDLSRANFSYSSLSTKPQGISNNDYARLGNIRAAEGLQVPLALDVLAGDSSVSSDHYGPQSFARAFSTLWKAPNLTHSVTMQTLSNLSAWEQSMNTNRNVQLLPVLANFFHGLSTRFSKPSDITSLPSIAFATAAVLSEAKTQLGLDVLAERGKVVDGVVAAVLKDIILKMDVGASGDEGTIARQVYTCEATCLFFFDRSEESLSERSFELYCQLLFLRAKKNTAVTSSERFGGEWYKRMEQLTDAWEYTRLDMWKKAQSCCQQERGSLILVNALSLVDDSLKAAAESGEGRYQVQPSDFFPRGLRLTVITTGVSYDVDLFAGYVLKNGVPISGLPSAIRDHPTFTELFGSDTNFQVFKEQDGSGYRTLQDMRESVFPGWPTELSVYYKFSLVANNELSVRLHVFEGSERRQVWVHIPRELFQDTLCEIYTLGCSHWVDEKSSVVVALGPTETKFQQCHLLMNPVASNSSSTTSSVKENSEIGVAELELYIVPAQQQRKGTDVLLGLVAARRFERLLPLTGKELRWSLGLFEEPRYTLFCVDFPSTSTGSSEHRTLSLANFSSGDCKLSLWLPRYELRFTIEPADPSAPPPATEKGGDSPLKVPVPAAGVSFVSQQFKGYELVLRRGDHDGDGSEGEPSQQYFRRSCGTKDQQLLRMLVFRKQPAKQRAGELAAPPPLPTQHRTFFLFSDTDSLEAFPTVFDVRMKHRRYWVHDHFYDIRASKRSDALFLAQVIAAFCTGSRFGGSHGWTGNELAIHLVRQCYSNTPLSQEEVGLVGRLLRHGSQNPSPTLMLSCQVLWEQAHCTSALFNKDDDEQQHRGFLGEHHADLIYAAKVNYEYQVQAGVLPPRESLQPHEMRWLRMIPSAAHLRPGPIEKGSLLRHSRALRALRSLVAEGREASSFEDAMTALLQSLPGQDEYGEDFPLKALLQSATTAGSEIMRELVEGLHKSWNARKNTKRPSFDVHILHSLAIGLRDRAAKCRRQVEVSLSALSSEWPRDGDLSSPLYLEWSAGKLPILSPLDYTNVLVDPLYLTQLFDGQLTPQEEGTIREAVGTYNALSVAVDKAERLLHFECTNDTEALTREIRSPREEIRKNPFWIAFEAEQKLQIRKQQFDTCQQLLNESLDIQCIVQLNMGEGKTQVILPMLVLFYLFAHRLPHQHTSCGGDEETRRRAELQQRRLPRVAFLSALISEARAHYQKFLSFSGFSLPLLEVPFARDVKVESTLPPRLRRVLSEFYWASPNGCMIIQTREHIASMVLKELEGKCSATTDSFALLDRNFGVVGEKELGQRRGDDDRSSCSLPVAFVDIFDEVDELMAPWFKLVYSVNASQELDNSVTRLEVIPRVLDALCSVFGELFKKGLLEIDGSLEANLEFINQGEIPRHRLLPAVENETAALEFSELVLEALLTPAVGCTELQLLTNPAKKATFFKVLVDPKEPFPEECPQRIVEALLLARGVLAHGILPHCLRLRWKVNYGQPCPKTRLDGKRVAVPYVSADVPSPRSEYQHPDVSILLSLLSYCYQGLTLEQFREGLKEFSTLNTNAQETQFCSWREIVSDWKLPTLTKAAQIDVTFAAQVNDLYGALWKNRRFIAFWLSHCVFPSDLRQYQDHLVATASDLLDGTHPILGFSGTKDNHPVIPQSLQEPENVNEEIRATDGFMIERLLKNTEGMRELSTSSSATTAAAAATKVEANAGTSVGAGAGDDDLTNTWQNLLLMATKERTLALIDAGALLAGQDTLKMVRWLTEQKEFLSFRTELKIEGVTFFYEGSWKVYSVARCMMLEARTDIEEENTFVIFDEARCRGADRLLRKEAVALLTLGPNLTKARLMQAAGRLRKFGRNQKLILCGTSAVLRNVFVNSESNPDDDLSAQIADTENTVKAVLKWSCKNTVQENEKYLLDYVEGADLSSQQRKKKTPLVQESRVDVRSLYSGTKLPQPVTTLFSPIVKDDEQNPDEITKLLREHLKKYGCGVKRLRSVMDDQCEREAEQEAEREREHEVSLAEHEPFCLDVENAKKVIAFFQQRITPSTAGEVGRRPFADLLSVPFIFDNAIQFCPGNSNMRIFGSLNFFSLFEDQPHPLEKGKRPDFLRLIDHFVCSKSLLSKKGTTDDDGKKGAIPTYEVYLLHPEEFSELFKDGSLAHPWEVKRLSDIELAESPTLLPAVAYMELMNGTATFSPKEKCQALEEMLLETMMKRTRIIRDRSSADGNPTARNDVGDESGDPHKVAGFFMDLRGSFKIHYPQSDLHTVAQCVDSKLALAGARPESS